MSPAGQDPHPARAQQESLQPRYERKFKIPAGHVSGASWVRQLPLVFRRSYPPRWVNNLYFDTPDYRHYHENIAGLPSRKKVRIRWYGDLEAGRAPTLELKARAGLCGYKRQFPLMEEGWGTGMTRNPRYGNLCNDLLSRVAFSSGEWSSQIHDLVPVLLNRYFRHYFEASGGRLRLTLDSYLGFFGVIGNRPPRDRGAEDLIVELKYHPSDETLARKVCQSFPYRLTRHSKYVRGLETLSRQGAFLP